MRRQPRRFVSTAQTTGPDSRVSPGFVQLPPIRQVNCVLLFARKEPALSIRMIDWAYAQQLDPSAKFVLVTIANFANERGRCWPSVKTLTTMTGLGRSTVHRALTRLKNRGLIKVIYREGHSNLFDILTPVIAGRPCPAAGQPPASQRDTPCPAAGPRTVIEPPFEPSRIRTDSENRQDDLRKPEPQSLAERLVYLRDEVAKRRPKP